MFKMSSKIKRKRKSEKTETSKPIIPAVKTSLPLFILSGFPCEVRTNAAPAIIKISAIPPADASSMFLTVDINSGGKEGRQPMAVSTQG